MDGKSLEQQIREAGQRSVPWHVLANLLHSRIGAASPVETAEIKALASSVTGYTVGLLNRYISAFARAKLIAESSRLQPSDLLSSVFSGVEAAVKLYDLDPDRGLDALRQLKEGKTTLAAVKTKLAEAKDSQVAAAGIPGLFPRRLSAIERERRQASIIQSLQKNFAPLGGRFDRVEWRKADKFLKSESIYRVDDGKDRGFSGVELIEFGPESDFKSVDALIPASVLRSTFFRYYYLVFWTAEADEHAKRAVRLLKWLEVDSIGVISVDKDGWLRGHPDMPFDLPASRDDRSLKLNALLFGEY